MKNLTYLEYLNAGINFTAWMFSAGKDLNGQMQQFAGDMDCNWTQMVDLVITQNKPLELMQILETRLVARPFAFGWFEVGANTIFVANMAATGAPAELLEGVLSGLRKNLEAVRVRIDKRDRLNDLMRQLTQGGIDEKSKILPRMIEFLRDEAMVRDERGERPVATRHSNPWISGSFYLVSAGVLIALLLIVAKQLSLWTLPLVIIGAVLLVSIVGALQLKNDDHLRDEPFVKLMGLAFRYLPLLKDRVKD
jgi:hypothetical protein